MVKLLAWVYTLLERWNKEVARASGILLTTCVIIDYVHQLWQDIFVRVDSLIQEASPGTLDFSPLSFVNSLFPLDTLLTCLASYAAIRLVCAAIRIIKSFIPTIA